MPIKRVFSAGGIIIRISTKSTKGTRGTKSGELEVLVTQHSKHKGWDFPKGHIESGESSEIAALREVEEETGVRAEIVERIGETKYFYWEEGSKVLKTVAIYLMRFISDGEATTAFEVSDHAWLPLDEVEDKLTFKDTKELWRKARAKIEELQLTINN